MPKSNGQAIEDPELDKRLLQYFKICDEMDKIKSKLSQFQMCKEQLQGHMQAWLDKNKLKSARTSSGVLLTLTVRPSAKLEDPDIFMNYVMKHGAYDLMERRASAEACQEYADEHDGVLPPGVKINRVQTVRVTRP